MVRNDWPSELGAGFARIVRLSVNLVEAVKECGSPYCVQTGGAAVQVRGAARQVCTSQHPVNLVFSSSLHPVSILSGDPCIPYLAHHTCSV